MQHVEFAIAQSVRFLIDPEMLAYILIEEFVHAQQTLDRVDFNAQRKQFPDYQNRPYEQEAKRIATEILGYEPEPTVPRILRPQPKGLLYDISSVNEPDGET